MKFTETLAAVAILATSAIVSAQCSTTFLGNAARFPLYFLTFYSQYHNWCVIDVTTESGATLKMMRVGSSKTDTPVASTLGPVLLHHGAFTDGHSWLTEQNEGQAILPIRLYNHGFDVYISNKRGTYTSPFTSGTDEENFAFSHDEIAKDDLPSMINAILKTRYDEDSADCKKVNVVGNSLGGAEALIMASELPEASLKYVKQIVNTVPCIVPDLTGILSVFAEVDPKQGDRRMMRKLNKSESDLVEKFDSLKKKQSMNSQADGVGFDFNFPVIHDLLNDTKDKSESFKEEIELLKELKKEYGNKIYRQIYKKWKTYKKENKSEWRENDWIEALIGFVCEIVPDSELCQDSPEDLWAAFVKTAREEEVYSFFGSEWVTQKNTLCAALDGTEENPICIMLRTFDAFSASIADPNHTGSNEMSLQQLDQLAQQAFTEDFITYEKDWLNTYADEYELSQIDVTVKNIFVDNDETNNDMAGQWYLDDIDTIESQGTQFNYGHSEMAGNNNNDFYYMLLSMLDPDGSAETFTCPATGIFDAWTA